MANKHKTAKKRNPPALTQSLLEEHSVMASLTLAHHKETRFSSPFPPPDILAGYQEIHPDFPERIIEFTEKEQTHRHALELRIVESQVKDLEAERTAEKRGQLYAFAICLAAFSCAGVVAFMGSPVSGVVLAMASLAGIVSVFITRKSRDTSDPRTDKDNSPSRTEEESSAP